MGVQIEYHDLPFDALGPTLLQGQIDVAIAAISKTPEREVYADFSNVYLVSQGAALAQQAAEFTLTQLDDIAKYKVGVQRNTVYKNQIQTGHAPGAAHAHARADECPGSAPVLRE
jgi:ABC-type amino acid transport substrate-binding protein